MARSRRGMASLARSVSTPTKPRCISHSAVDSSATARAVSSTPQSDMIPWGSICSWRSATKNEYRRVHLAHQRLIECDYLKRTVRVSSATKETNCWQPGTTDGYRVIRDGASRIAQQEAKNEGRITLIKSSNDLYLESLD